MLVSAIKAQYVTDDTHGTGSQYLLKVFIACCFLSLFSSQSINAKGVMSSSILFSKTTPNCAQFTTMQGKWLEVFVAICKLPMLGIMTFVGAIFY